MAQTKLNATLGMSGNLPAVNGSAVTNLTSGNLSGNLPALNGSALTTLTSANLTGNLPALNGSAITSLTPANLSGAVPVNKGGTALTSGFNNGGGNAQMWHLSSSFTGDVDPIANNIQKAQKTLSGKLGSDMAVNSGVWTFPSTGIWKVDFNLMTNTANTAIRWQSAWIYTTNDNGSNWYTHAETGQGVPANSSGAISASARVSTIIDITDLSNHKVKFAFDGDGTGSVVGGTAQMQTFFLFTRMGDT